MERASNPEGFYTASPVSTTLKGVLLIIVLLAGAFGVAEIFHSKVRYADDIENYLQLTLLTSIHEFPRKKKLIRVRSKE